MDLLNKYLKGCSPYIMELSYDLEKREFSIICAKQISDCTACKGIKFIDVVRFTEETSEGLTDDDCADSVIGLHEVERGVYCLSTEKRELIIHTMKMPISVVV